MTPQQRSARKPGRVRRAVTAGAVAFTLSAGGAAAWAVDRYVVPHVEISDVSACQASQAGTTADTSAAASGTGGAVTTDTSYVSDSSKISISKVTTGSGDSTVTTKAAASLVFSGRRWRPALVVPENRWRRRESAVAIRACRSLL